MMDDDIKYMFHPSVLWYNTRNPRGYKYMELKNILVDIKRYE